MEGDTREERSDSSREDERGEGVMEGVKGNRKGQDQCWGNRPQRETDPKARKAAEGEWVVVGERDEKG